MHESEASKTLVICFGNVYPEKSFFILYLVCSVSLNVISIPLIAVTGIVCSGTCSGVMVRLVDSESSDLRLEL